jgi:hypothetical protein
MTAITDLLGQAFVEREKPRQCQKLNSVGTDE